MVFEYNWKNNEANFGPPISEEVDGGTHISFEIIPKFEGKYVALRRMSNPGHESPPKIKDYPNGVLFFCHNLIIYGESIEDFVKRVVKEVAGVGVKSYKVVDIETTIMEESGGKKIKQWAFTPHITVELDSLPQIGVYGNEISEVVTFDKNSVPSDFAWWEKEDLEEFLKEFDSMERMIDITRNSDRKIELINFLEGKFIGNMSTSGKDSSNLATIFFVIDNNKLYFKSRTASIHSSNLKNSNKVSFTVYSPDSTYKSKYGVQLKGKVKRIVDESIMSKVVDVYSSAFEGAGAKLPSIKELCSNDIKSTFYELLIEEFKIIDEDSIQNRTMLEFQNFEASEKIN